MFSRTVSRIICTALVLAFAVLSAISAVCADFPEQRASVYVYDSADVISSEIEDDINRRADALYAMCGAQIITVCVTTTGDTPIDKYTAELFNTWKIGSVQRNNGMLLIMATEDREYWILQGNGIKNDITDSDLQAVNNECLEQYFRDEKYGEGALAVFDRLLEKFQALYSIDISNWDGKYIDFSYPETESESDDAQKQTSPGKPLMGFFKTVLWIAAAVLLILIRPAPLGIRKRFIAPQAQKQGRTQPVRRNSAESQPLRKPRRRAPSHVRRRSPRPSERLCAERNEAKHFPRASGTASRNAESAVHSGSPDAQSAAVPRRSPVHGRARSAPRSA